MGNDSGWHHNSGGLQTKNDIQMEPTVVGDGKQQ